MENYDELKERLKKEHEDTMATFNLVVENIFGKAEEDEDAENEEEK